MNRVMGKVWGLCAIAGALSGCANLDSAALGYEGGPKLFVWKSDYSAGISNGKGICAQGALTARATSVSGTGSVSDRVLGPGVVNNSSPSNLVDLAAAQNETVTLLNATNNQTAFANIAFFYLCQISLNGEVEDAAIADMWRATVDALPTIGTVAVAPGSVESTPVEDLADDS